MTSDSVEVPPQYANYSVVTNMLKSGESIHTVESYDFSNLGMEYDLPCMSDGGTDLMSAAPVETVWEDYIRGLMQEIGVGGEVYSGQL